MEVLMKTFYEPDEQGRMRITESKGSKQPIKLAKGKNLMVPVNLQQKYEDLKNIENYHKNKLKLRKRGII